MLVVSSIKIAKGNRGENGIIVNIIGYKYLKSHKSSSFFGILFIRHLCYSVIVVIIITIILIIIIQYQPGAQNYLAVCSPSKK